MTQVVWAGVRALHLSCFRGFRLRPNTQRPYDSASLFLVPFLCTVYCIHGQALRERYDALVSVSTFEPFRGCLCCGRFNGGEGLAGKRCAKRQERAMLLSLVVKYNNSTQTNRMHAHIDRRIASSGH